MEKLNLIKFCSLKILTLISSCLLANAAFCQNEIINISGRYCYYDSSKKEISLISSSNIGTTTHLIFSEDDFQGILNQNGDVIVKPQFKKLDFMSKANSIDRNYELLIAKRGDSSAILDLSGHPKTDYEFSYIGQLKNGFKVAKKDRKYGVLDNNYNNIIPYIYDDLIQRPNLGYLVKINDKYGLIDFNGKELVPIIYDQLNFVTSNIFRASLNGTHGYIDSNNNLLFPISNEGEAYWDSITIDKGNEKCIFVANKLFCADRILNTFDGKRFEIRFKKNGNWGFMDDSNKVVFEAIYEDSSRLTDDLFEITNGDGTALYHIGKEKFLTDFIFGDIGVFVESIAIAQINKKGVLLKKNGKLIKLPKEVEHIEKFQRDPNFLKFKNKKNKVGLLNRKGKIIIPPVYDNIEFEDEDIVESTNYFFVEKDGLWGVIDTQNNLIIPYKYTSDYLCKNNLIFCVLSVG